VLALGATLVWSSLYSVVRVLAPGYSPADLTFWRWILAFGLFLPFVWSGLAAHRRLILRNLPLLAVASLSGMIGFSLAIFMAGKTTTAINMSLLVATSPVLIALICRFVLRERLSRARIAGLLVAVSGVVVVITGANPDLLFSLRLTGGDVWALGAAGSFGLYSILIRFKPPEMPANVLLAAIMGLGILWSLPLFVGQRLWSGPPPAPDRIEILCLLHLGIGASLLAYLFWNKAILLIGPIRAGMVYYSLPLFSCVMAMIFVDERPGLPQAAGGLLIVGGIVLSSLSLFLPSRGASAPRVPQSPIPPEE
jgi:drug/metabolite transporter (DMT)-like permease